MQHYGIYCYKDNKLNCIIIDVDESLFYKEIDFINAICATLEFIEKNSGCYVLIRNIPCPLKLKMSMQRFINKIVISNLEKFGVKELFYLITESNLSPICKRVFQKYQFIKVFTNINDVEKCLGSKSEAKLSGV